MRGKVGSALAVAVVASSLTAGSPPAGALSSAESSFVRRINAERTSRGLRALKVRGDLESIAGAHAARMAARGRIFHNSALTSQVSGWRVIGENVGMDSSVSSMHERFMSSSTHRAQILDPRFNELGVGVSSAGGKIYVDEVFVRRGTVAPRVVHRASRSAPRAPPPKPRPKPRPADLTLGVLLRLISMFADEQPQR